MKALMNEFLNPLAKLVFAGGKFVFGLLVFMNGLVFVLGSVFLVGLGLSNLVRGYEVNWSESCMILTLMIFCGVTNVIVGATNIRQSAGDANTSKNALRAPNSFVMLGGIMMFLCGVAGLLFGLIQR